MTISQFVYERLVNSTNVSSVVSSNVYPDTGLVETIPFVAYSILSEDKNKTIRQPIFSIRCVETSQNACLTLNDYIYQLFDDSTSNLAEMSSGIKVESMVIINNIPAQYDTGNRNWFGVTDIRFNYIN